MVVDSGPTLATARCEDAEFTESVTVVAGARQLLTRQPAPSTKENQPRFGRHDPACRHVEGRPDDGLRAAITHEERTSPLRQAELCLT